MENQSGHHIKILRIDRGGEYVSNEFINFCKTHGMQKQFTAQYTPQENNVSERKNITIMEMTRIVMETKYLSNEYWTEAISTDVYFMKQFLTKSVKNKVPQEAWTCMNHSVSHLKVVGFCICSCAR